MYCSTHPNTEELFQTVLTAYTKAVGSQGYFELILLNVRLIDWIKLMKSMKCLSIKLFSMKYWLIWNWLNWLEWINLIWAHLNQFKSPSIHKILTHIVLFHVINWWELNITRIFHVNKLVSNIKQASEILKKFEEIRQRGRKRTMLG